MFTMSQFYFDDSIAQVVEYSYDFWVTPPITKTGTLATTFGTLSPFRYRGYVYEEETGLYYLRSRYYNPVWGRFLNADSVLGKPGQLLGHNVFGYCRNNPLVMSDFSGRIPQNNVFQSDSGSSAGGPLAIGLAVLAYSFFDGTVQTLKQNFSSTPISRDIIVARPAVVAKTSTRELVDTEASDRMTNGLYYIAWVGDDGYLHRLGNGMHYYEAVLYLGFSDTLDNNSRQFNGNPWGVYTHYQSDAKILAVTSGDFSLPTVHGIGYYGHYHDQRHKFHIWFGMPLE